MFLRPAFAVVILALTAACAAPPPPAPPPRPVVLDPDAACLKELRDRRVAFEVQPPMANAGTCTVPNPVKVASDSQAAWSRPGLVSCSMARTVDRFETQVVEPLARRYLGKGVARLHHMGTYNCRNRRTETNVAASDMGSRGGRPSEHAKGQAIDIGAFELDDGTMISVKKDWSGQGKKSEFLQAVARASCEHFNVVLTPNHNRLHADHLHLDIGPHRLCGL